MNTRKTTKYIRFEEITTKPLYIAIVNKRSNEEIASIEYYSSWRQYCFFPGCGTVWNDECLQEVRIILDELNKSKKIPNSQSKQ
jgi:hypothetical protein